MSAIAQDQDRNAQLAFGLREAPKEDVKEEWSRFIRERRNTNGDIVAGGLTYREATAYLSQVYNKLERSGRARACFCHPWVVGWIEDPVDGRGHGSACGFVVEVWMVQQKPDSGLWDIVDKSKTLYRLPWMFGMGWCKE